jgi:hypothetical protein
MRMGTATDELKKTRQVMRQSSGTTICRRSASRLVVCHLGEKFYVGLTTIINSKHSNGFQKYPLNGTNTDQEVMHQRCTSLDERGSSVADLFPSWERLSEEPKLPHSVTLSAAKVYRAGKRDASRSLP